ncbi:putative F-box/kelch-repeat protein At4g22430 [Panicum hallii]|uniref:putative F-box/kelch-repeat protein At4g22430 n=1 Tax=Panicum hallii TaxID=206008 RepID=UPI000DF4CE9C|nr:putative F-box/kelch-repeat protein At4g22430 [Panicum hallii]XP_025804031.1 putative F-box/kelch-repeat protein At4g22430 [Panicum hallii]
MSTAMDRPNRSASAVGDLPNGPLVEILSRVPAKSVCRFKCVSKAWLGLIDDPHNRKRLPQAMQRLFCRTHEIPEGGIDIFNFEDGNVGSFGFSFVDLAARSVPLDIDPCFSFLTELPGIQNLVLRNSCNGLVLFENRQKPYSGTLASIMCNPTTKQWVAVPTCGSPGMFIFTYTYLAFDAAVSSHFHLVHFKVASGEKLISVNAYSAETGTWSHNRIDEEEEQ